MPLEHYINGRKVKAETAEKRLAEAEKSGKPVQYDTVDTSKPDDKARAMAAINALETVTPGELATHLSAAADIYPGVKEVSTDDAKGLLDALHDDGEIVSAGGSRFKVKEED